MGGVHRQASVELEIIPYCPLRSTFWQESSSRAHRRPWHGRAGDPIDDCQAKKLSLSCAVVHARVAGQFVV
jgi:hypothetical protein